MGAPLFSIVATVYNQAAFVDPMLDSVATQRFRDFELIVVDDGSTDDTPRRLAAWVDRWRTGQPASWQMAHGTTRRNGAARPSRLAIVRIPNAGQSAALEDGIALARGRYIALLDGDDRFLPHKLERLAAAAAAEPAAGMLVHPLFVIDAQGRRTGDVRPKGARLAGGDLRASVRRDARLAVPGTSAITVRADVLRAMLPMPTRRFKTMADAYIPLAASLAAPVHVIAEPLAEYRMHPDGAHLRSLATPAGLAAWLEAQEAVARHLGLETAMRRNVTYARNAFALARVRDGWISGWRRYGRLACATIADPAFSVGRRVQFLAWWTWLACAPAGLFERHWRWFLRYTSGGAVPPDAEASLRVRAAPRSSRSVPAGP